VELRAPELINKRKYIKASRCLQPMNQHVRSRIKAIQDSLLATYRGGAGLPSAMVGGERELVLHGLLRETLPPIYRFGQGVITDATSQLTGQIDLVMELPFGPSLPMPAGSHRLYLAESVAAVIEIKSDLSSQWRDMENTIRLVRQLDRDPGHPTRFVTEESPLPDKRITEIQGIPCYAVGFRGFSTVERLCQRLEMTEPAARPHGALVIESGAFVGVTGSADGEAGLYRLIAELVEVFNSAVGVAYPRFSAYVEP
jgi:uncharacterized protein DUF6602